MIQNNVSNVVLTSRNSDYPNFYDKAVNELGYEIHTQYADKQISFVCSYPDEKTSPFISCNTNQALPFICLNISNGGAKEAYITEYCDIMFGNEIKSADLGTHKIYITQKFASKILNKEAPSKDDFKSLIGQKILFSIIKKGVASKSSFEIVDITTNFVYPWMKELYGEEIVFGGYNCGMQAIMDNFMVHSVLINDIYSNAYFFLKVKERIFENKCSYICGYNVFSNNKITSNDTLNNIVSANINFPTYQRVLIGLVFLLLAGTASYFVVFINKNDPFSITKRKYFPLIFSLLFVTTIIVAYFFNFIYYLNFSLFSPFGIIISLIAFIIVFIYLIFMIKKNRDNIVCLDIKI